MGRDLWQRFDNGDNLLFREEDVPNPTESLLFHELWKLEDPAVHVLVGRLLLATQQPLSEAPFLEDLHRDGKLLGLRREEERRAEAALHGTVAAESTNALASHEHPGDPLAADTEPRESAE